MTFLMMLSVKFTSILIILLSALSVIRHLIYSNVGKTRLVSFDWSNNTGAIDVKIDGCVLEEKPSFKMLVLTETLGSLSKYSRLKSFLSVSLW